MKKLNIFLFVIIVINLVHAFDPKLRQKFKNTNFAHQSILNQDIFLSGETLKISNHVSKLGYNIAGREQVVLIEAKSPSLFKKNDQKIVMLTDKFGCSVTNVKLNNHGKFIITVMFINKRSGYYEELIKHEITVVSPKRLLSFFLITLLCLFIPGLLIKKFAGRTDWTHSLLSFNWIEAFYKLYFNRIGELGPHSIWGGIGIGLICLISYFLKESEVVMLFLIILIYLWMIISLIKKQSITYFPLMAMGISAIICFFLVDSFLFKYSDYLAQNFESTKYLFLFGVGFIFPAYMVGPIAGALYKIGMPLGYSIISFMISTLPTLYLFFKYKKSKVED